jgi:type IV pilus assembly protein PilA
MKNTKLNIRKIGTQGFSLVEMLVVIAVIGVIAALALPNIANINDSARTSTAQRNAQTIASTISAAVAAGYDFTATTTATVIDEISDADGITVTDGPFSGKRFIVPNVPATGSTERTKLQTYLNWDDTSSSMEYDADAAASN